MEERICRICMAVESASEYTRIFENNLALKIFLVTSVKIIETKRLPALICKTCEIEVYQCINFRKKIQTSREYFDRKLPCLETFLNEINEEEILLEEDCSTEQQEIIEERIDLNETIVEYLDDPEESDNIISSTVIESIHKLKDEISETSHTRSNTCKYCGLQLSRRQRLIQHERLHVLEASNKYTCDKCGKKFNQRFGLIPHFQKNHCFKPEKVKEKWKCAICHDKILAPGNMEVHYRKVHNEFYCCDNSFQASKCQKSLIKNNKPKKKISTIPRCKELKKQKIFFPCEICGNSFTSSQRYYKHLNDLHGVIQTDSVFDNVEMSNAVAKNINQKYKNIPCSTCGKMFANLNTCKTHEKIHSGMRYVCDLCGSSFSMKPYLTSHVQKVHLKLKRFKCSLCTQTFVHRELLNYHIKKHLNIRNYSCQFCQKTFVRKACAIIHERIHKNERPYSCKYCDRQFIHHSDHRRHELRHINDISYTSFPTE